MPLPSINLRTLNSAGGETCEEHWNSESTSAGNPDIPNLVLSNYTASTSVFKEVLHCFSAVKIYPSLSLNLAQYPVYVRGVKLLLENY